jgi:YfiH family protein
MNRVDIDAKQLPYITIPALEQHVHIRHAFTTRQAGLGGRQSGIRTPADWQAVAGSFGTDGDRIVTVRQVHGDDIVAVNERNFRDVHAMQADALVTDVPGIAVGVETADCVPVLLVDPAGPAVAAVHAGWRSTVKGIVQKTVLLMQHAYGCDPSRIAAAIGPAIGPECYEVDEPVMGPLREAFPFWREVAASRGNGRWSLDLVKTNRFALGAAGLRERNIHSLGMCTSCRRDLFYSFRAEGRTGRMLSAIMIRT